MGRCGRRGLAGAGGGVASSRRRRRPLLRRHPDLRQASVFAHLSLATDRHRALDGVHRVADVGDNLAVH